MHIADTVTLIDNKINNLTKKVNYNFVDIGYDME